MAFRGGEWRKCENRDERYLMKVPPRCQLEDGCSGGVRLNISRRALGIILLVTGLALMASYFALVRTDVGPIAELVGVGFCFMFLGLLTTIGEVMGLYAEGGR